MTGKNAGRRRVIPEKSSKSYVIYEKCSHTPMHAYIDYVCNDNQDAFIVEGAPPAEVVETAKNALLSEFHSLMDKGDGISRNNKDILKYRSLIWGLTISAKVFHTQRQEALNYLKHQSIYPKKDDEATLKLIESKIKLYSRKLSESESKYHAEISDSKKHKMSEKDYDDSFALLSSSLNLRLTPAITMSEYAAYIRQYSKLIQFNPRPHGK